MALITAYFVLSSLLTLSVGFALSSINELNAIRRTQDSTKAFWFAEAGINEFMANTNLVDDGQPGVGCDNSINTCELEVTINGQDITIQKIDTSSTRYVVATANVSGSERQIQIQFPKSPPAVFDNTLSSGGNIALTGFVGWLDAYGKTRITGTFTKSNATLTGWFEDKQQGVSNTLTTLKYPDADNNGTADQFNDFVEFNRDIISTYPANEVIYIQSNSTQTIIPNSQLVGKKIIYVEGTAAGTGNVNIVFNASWQANQNVTVISTGTVNYIQPLTVAADSQLNTISWKDYYEPSILYSTHAGTTYAHEKARFVEVLDYSTTQGAVIANTSISASETLAHKEFHFDDPLTNENVPPGFEGLIGSSNSGSSYVSDPTSWEEI